MSYKEEQRARFWELQAKRDAITSKSYPLREKRDAHVQKARATEEAMNAEIKAIETDLFDIDVERGFIASALGNVGEGPSKKAA